MAGKPETRYAKSGSVHIAYQVIGDGPLDIVFVPGWVSHLEMNWEMPALAQFLNRLASFSRVIIFDKRGTGLSDAVQVAQLPSLEQRMDDVRAVMDEARVERATLIGMSEGGPMNLLYSATYPQRTHALVLMSTYARMAWAADHVFGVTSDNFDALIRRIAEQWGRGVMLGSMAPGFADDAGVRQFWARYQRLAASPGAAVALMQMAREIDARHVLPVVKVPTLIIHRQGDRFIPVEHGRYTARQIRGAKYLELPGDDHLPWLGDANVVLDEIQHFLTGVRDRPLPETVLATVLFIDIVDSTSIAARVGDSQWRSLLEAFYVAVRQVLTQFRGREVDTAGDGFLAAFDGPARAVHCACAAAAAVRTLGIRVRCGLHTGECHVLKEKLAGLAVHIGARVASLAKPGEVLVSSTVRDLIAGSGLIFVDRGLQELKGVPGSWQLSAVDQSRSSLMGSTS
jgi:pimeloyl-ACP methyl ester carboxylesterase